MGVGMPAELMLQEFGSQVWFAFGDVPYHVGSSAKGKREKNEWRDVDVRLILADEEYAALFDGMEQRDEFLSGKWIALCRAFSALGKEMTGLPIDFQIQQRTFANKTFPMAEGHHRSALGQVPLRYKK